MCLVGSIMIISFIYILSLKFAIFNFLMDYFPFIFKVDENICKFAKKGMTPSQIGVILRDSHGIAQVKSVTGSKILRILKAHGALLSLIFLLLHEFRF